MNVQDLADQLAERHGLSKGDMREMMSAVAEAIAENARSGEEFSWPGFGKFKLRERAARTGRNPATGEAIQVAASRKLVFQPAKTLKDSLNGATGQRKAASAGKGAGKSAGKATKASGAGKSAKPATGKGRSAPEGSRKSA